MTRLLSILFVLILSATTSFSQGNKPGNFMVSLGASKNSYFVPLFQRASTFEFPLNMEVMLPRDFSIGIKGSPVLINNVSNSYLENKNSTKKNDNTGFLLFGMGNISYYAYSEYRLMWKLIGEFGYGIMDKIKYEEDIKSEVKAKGIIYRFATTLRYHLGDDYDDVYPAFFELSLGTSRLNMNVNESTLEGVLLPSTHSTWSPLNFNTLDVALNFGYRFGKAK